MSPYRIAPEPPQPPGRLFLRGIMVGLCVIGLCPALVTPGCGVTRQEVTAAAPVAELLDATACTVLLGLVGGAAACPEEEALVASAIAFAETELPDAGAPVATTSPTASAPRVTAAKSVPTTALLGAPLHQGSRLVGRCPCGWSAQRVASAQRWIDSQPDGGR